MPEMKYYEVAFSNTDEEDCNAAWICIRGIDAPTLSELQLFLKKDIQKLGMPAVAVFPIDRDYAEACYDFSNEQKWPIFTRRGPENKMYNRLRSSFAKLRRDNIRK